MIDKEYRMANFATFVSKTLTFPLKKWINLISNQLSIASIKYLNWPSPVFGRFQNGCNKVVIELRVVQFWSENILVISNRTCAARSTDFEITRIISAQIALHSVQLPLSIKCIVNCARSYRWRRLRALYLNSALVWRKARALWKYNELVLTNHVTCISLNIL